MLMWKKGYTSGNNHGTYSLHGAYKELFWEEFPIMSKALRDLFNLIYTQTEIETAGWPERLYWT